MARDYWIRFAHPSPPPDLGGGVDVKMRVSEDAYTKNFRYPSVEVRSIRMCSGCLTGLATSQEGGG